MASSLNKRRLNKEFTSGSFGDVDIDIAFKKKVNKQMSSGMPMNAPKPFSQKDLFFKILKSLNSPNRV
jgi:hypothetical protein